MKKEGLATRVILYSIVVGILVSIALASSNSVSAVSQKKQEYQLGERVQILLEKGSLYTLKITTPTRTLVLENVNASYTFQPQEVGNYQVVIQNGSEFLSQYEFKIIAVQNDTEVVQAPVSIKQNVTPVVQNTIQQVTLDRQPFIDTTENRTLLREQTGNALQFKFRFNKPSVQQTRFQRVIASAEHMVQKVLGQESTTLTITNSEGDMVLNLDPEIEESDENITVQLPHPDLLQPGVYSMKVEKKEGDDIQEQEQQFAWGLISINTDRSQYVPVQEARITLIVLDSGGHSVCDAALQLKITDPLRRVSYADYPTNITSPECGIYEFFYSVEEVGVYTLKATTYLEEQEIEFTTTFESLMSLPYEIVRTADSKIDPTIYDQFTMYINVSTTNNSVTSLHIQEPVPQSFEITNTTAKIRLEGGYKILEWLVPGRTAQVSYDFAVPPRWPYRYAVGPLQVNGFLESRPWYIAVDPIIQVDNRSSVDITLQALDNRTYVVSWVTAGNITFKVLDTNGTNLTGNILVDQTVNGNSRVALTAINTTHFIVSWFDGPSGDVSYAWYTRTGTNVVTQTDMDTDVSTNVDIATIEMTNRFQSCYIDATSGDSSISTVLHSSLGAGTQTDVDTNSAPGATLQNLIACAPINQTRFVAVWFDDNSNDVSFTIRDEDVNSIVGTTDLDTGVGETGQVAIAGLNQDAFAAGWFDIAGGDTGSIEVSIRTKDNTILVSDEFVDASAGASTRIAMATVKESKNAKDSFVIAWNDQNVSNIQAAVYNASGTLLYGPYTLESNENTSSLLFDVYARDPLSNISICDGTYLFAYTNTSGAVIVETLNLDGTLWSGICGESDTTAPFITLMTPNNATTATTGFDLEFVYNVTDTSILANCSLYINGVRRQIYPAPGRDDNQTFTQFLDNGNYLWAIECTDASNNRNITQNRTLFVNISQGEFAGTGRFYETFNGSFATGKTAVIRLNNSRDTVQDSSSIAISPSSLETLANATSLFMMNNGAFIPSGTAVTFSSSFTVTHVNVEATWKLYVVNSTTSRLLCQNGDDNTAGTPINAGTITASNATCVSAGIRLSKEDRIKLILNGYNTAAGTTRTITHVWDGSTSSYVDINITTEGFLNISLYAPNQSQSILTGQTLNVSCQVACTIGYCRNTNVSIEYNTSTINWTMVNGSGNIVLAAGQNITRYVGNLSTVPRTINFTINGSLASVNNIRCIAKSWFDSINSTETRQITVTTSQSAPNVNLTTPVENFAFNTSTVTLSYNATDSNNNIRNATLILNNVNNNTNVSAVLNGFINNFTLPLLDGYYNWTVNVTDTTNLTGTAPTRAFIVDTRRPFVNLTTPANGATFQTNNIFFNFTVVDNLDSSLICNLTLDSVVQDANILSPNGTIMNRSISSVSVGTHLWNVTCMDDALNVNTSITRNFTVQDLPPKVDYLTANNSFSNTGNITLSYNASDNNGIRFTTLIINDLVNRTNATAVFNGIVTNFSIINFPNGVYFWRINATDTSGLNSTNETRIFTIDRTIPRVELNLPANNSFSNSSSVNFNFTAIDNLDASLICNLTVANVQDNLFAAPNGTLTNRAITGLTDGPKLWNVTCIDDAGNINRSISRVITITEYPRITLNTANNSFFNTTFINLTYTPTDNTNFSSCSLFVDGIFNKTNQTTILNGQQNNFSFAATGGRHNWFVSCNDTFGLRNVSENRTFTVDLGGLNVTLLAPPNGANIFTSDVNFNYTVIDDLDTAIDCNITVNNLVVDSFAATNGSVTSRNVNFQTGGLKVWNVTCIDNALNIITSTTRNFTLAFPPIISLVSPLNNSFTNSSNITFIYNASDVNFNLANTTLVLNGQRNQTNTTAINNGLNTSFNLILEDGYYNWTVNATDSTNLFGTTSEYFLVVDTRRPTILLNNPLDNVTLTYSNNITFNFTVFDNLDTSVMCNLSLNDFNEFENIVTQNATEVVRYLARSDGNYSWDVTCIDDAGNSNISSTYNFTIRSPPNVTLINPSNEQMINSSSIDFIYLPQDAIGIFNCSLYIDSIFNTSSDTITANQNNAFSVNGLTEGRHNWTVACTDVFPDFNLYSPSVYNFTVDTQAPSVFLNNPLNGTNALRQVTFNFSATDTFSTNLSCNLFVDGVLNASGINITNGSSTSILKGNYTLGSHVWNVSCTDIALNTNWSTTWIFNVTLPDVSIVPEDISFNNTAPVENETIMINATIRNLVNVTLQNVIVQFYKGDPDAGGIQIGSNQIIPTLIGNGSATVNVTWNAIVGTTLITVVVDPPIATNGIIEEANESNNRANKTIMVGGWHFVYGEVTSSSEYDLGDNDTLRILRWQATNTANGTLFVADSESVITWTALQALGRNITGENGTNDFSEVDTLLNMSTFTDSVSTLYTNSQVPNNVTSFDIFQRTVQNVPIANSINNTNFMTGIIWDTSDDTNGEFNSADKEDLLFITKMNKQQPGAYGTYDYEIRIPANLRAYIPADSKKVVFYTELM